MSEEGEKGKDESFAKSGKKETQREGGIRMSYIGASGSMRSI
jgi:hypothetical protein